MLRLSDAWRGAKRNLRDLRSLLLGRRHVQFRNPEYEGGANKVSLKDARQNFLDYGVSELCFKSDVARREPEERP